MSALDGIELFAATVDAGSFAAAARRLGVTPSAVSRRVANLEAELGVALLARTTRVLKLTDDGRSFHERCRRILDELREARDAIARTTALPVGAVRVDVPLAFGRRVVAPALPAFLARYPELRLELTLRDQFIDPIAEAIDLVVRIGRLGDSTLIARRLGATRIVMCAAPSYLRVRGTPRSPEDLAHHACIGYLREGHPAPFRFVGESSPYEVPIAGPCHANDADVLRQLAVAGCGIVSLFDFLVTDALASGALVTVLDDHRSTEWPIHALYPRNRHLVPKVAAVLELLIELCRPRTSVPPSSKARRPAGA